MSDFFVLLFHTLYFIINDMSEHHEQAHVFTWAEFSKRRYPCLNYLNGSLSGIRLSIGQAVKAKRSGMKRGIPDIHLPYNNGKYTSLYVEMKVNKNRPTTDQIGWMTYLESQGAKCFVCYSAGEAIEKIIKYIMEDTCLTQEERATNLLKKC